MKTPRILVVGSLNMDLSVRVPSLPRPGETIAGDDLRHAAGGKGANQAVAAARLGASSALLGVVGSDSFGTQLCSELAAAGVDVSAVGTVEQVPTGVALVVVGPDGENMITISPGANGHLNPRHVAAAATLFADADAVLLQLEVPLGTACAAAAAARAAGALIVLNAAPLPAAPDDRLAGLLALVDVLVVNETEAAGLDADRETEPVSQAAALRRLGPAEVVVTLGADGAVAADAAGTHRIASFPVAAVDTVGAGDAFCAELTIARASGVALAGATRRACAAGALATTRYGAQPAMPLRSDIEALIGMKV